MTELPASPFTEQERSTLQAQAFLLLQCGRFQEAYQLFQALVAIEPDQDRVLPGLTVSALKAGRSAEAIQLCESLMQSPKWKQDPQLTLCLSRALWAEGRQEEARTTYQTFLTLQSSLTSGVIDDGQARG